MSFYWYYYQITNIKTCSIIFSCLLCLFCRYHGTKNYSPSVVILRIPHNLWKVSVYIPSMMVIFKYIIGFFCDLNYYNQFSTVSLSHWMSLIPIHLHGQCCRNMGNHRYILASHMLFQFFTLVSWTETLFVIFFCFSVSHGGQSVSRGYYLGDICWARCKEITSERFACTWSETMTCDEIDSM